MHHTQAKAHPSDPAVNDIELFVAHSREHGDDVRLPGQSQEDRRTCDGHQAGSNGQGRRAKTPKLTIVRSDGERQNGKKEGEEEEGDEQSVRRESQPIKRSARKSPVGKVPGDGDGFVKSSPRLSSRQIRTRASIGPDAKAVGEHEDEDEDDIEPGGPVAVLVLVIVRHLFLGPVVGRFKGQTGIITTSGVGQREAFQYGVRDVSRLLHGRFFDSLILSTFDSFSLCNFRDADNRKRGTTRGF